MILYDGIIERLQSTGGVSVVFNEIISRMKREEFLYISYDYQSKITKNNKVIKSKFLERYIDVDTSFLSNVECEIFHSTYYRLPKDKSLSIVTTVHDFTYEKYIKGPAKWLHSSQKNRAIKNSDRIICVSKNTANDLLKYTNINESKINIVYNGVSNDYFQIEESIAITNEVVFVGARGGYKNFLAAIDVISLCPNLSLSIVGGGSLTSKEVLYLNEKIPGRYSWLGRLSNDELNNVYNRAYCLLYPSSYEGFGIPIIEAMRAGCPVVALNLSSIPEVSGNAAILIDELDINLLSEALKSLDNIVQRNNYIQAGLLNSQRFSWDKCYEETNKVYQSLK